MVSWKDFDSLSSYETLQSLKNHVDVSKCTLVVSIAPCSNCAKFILASGIKTVYYVDLYDRSDAGIEFLKKHNITVEKI